MNLKEIILDTIRLMRNARLRTFLTMLGIIIGISSVIIITSIGKGETVLLKKAFEKMGKNQIVIRLNMNYQGTYKPTYNDGFSLDDLKFVQKNPNIELASMNNWINQISINEPSNFKLGKNEKLNPSIATSSYFKISNKKFVAGRCYSPDEQNKFIVIGNGLATRLFGAPQNAVGKKIAFNVLWTGNNTNFKFTVIGVVDNIQFDISKVTGEDSIRYLFYIPVTQYHKMFNWIFDDTILCKIKDGVNLNKAGKQLVNQFNIKKNVSDGVYKYSIPNTRILTLDNALKKQNLYVTVIAGISLLVGGIVIMNIMLFTVTERTREIGVRRALGAKKKDIMFQFLIESAIMTLFGGVIGIAIGSLGTVISGFFLAVPPVLSINAILFSTVISILTGVVFGLYPAGKAAKLDPVEALRRE